MNEQSNSGLCLLPVISIECNEHRGYQVHSICTDPDCEQPFICEQCCVHSTYHNVLQKDQFLITFSKDIEKNVRLQQSIFEQTVGRKENINLLRWVEGCESHVEKLRDYIKAQKFMFQQDINEFTQQITKTLEEIKVSSFAQFDAFLANYKNSVETFRMFKSDVFSLLEKFKYLANPNVLAAKLINRSSEKAIQTIIDAKKAVKIAEESNASSADFVKQFKCSLDELNKLIDNLPLYKGSGSFADELTAPITQQLQNFFSSNLEINQFQPISLSLKNYKDNRLSTSSNSIRKLSSEPLSLSMRYGQSLVSNHSQLQNQSIFKTPFLLNYFNEYLGRNEEEFINIQHRQIVANGQSIFQEIANHDFHEVSYASYIPMKVIGKEIEKIAVSESPTAICYLGYNLIVVAGRDLQVLDLIERKPICVEEREVNLHFSDITSIINISSAFQPLAFRDKIIFATTAADSSVIFWTVDKKKTLESYKKLLGFLMPVQIMLDLHDGQRILTADSSNEISMLEYHSYKWCHSKKRKIERKKQG